MQIYQALSTDAPLPQTIAWVGGGGKTSGLFGLAQELKIQGKRVLIATTTKIYHPRPEQYDNLYIGALPEDAPASSISVWSPAHIKEQDKLDSIDQQLPKAALDLFDHILIEADGAKHKPLKAPRTGEPVLPSPCDLVVAVTGWEALSQPITAKLVHRWPEFKALTRAQAHKPLNPEHLQPLLEQDKGLFGAYRGRRIWLINKLDQQTDLDAAKALAEKILPRCPTLGGIVLASFHAPDPVHTCINRGS